ncbi:MAG: AmmeMemoRadiSam system protein A [Melioribacteraceae bacterium]|nr:AmmeMemoRadiSam system protein A [Melioribacteraceae bacterium]
MKISTEEKVILLNAARDSIKSEFDEVEIQIPDYNKFPLLKSKCGAFVTITENKNLRGCIGYIISNKKLFETVCDAAIQAAFHDPRFYPLQKNELEKIKIEISILSEPFPLKSYDEIQLGVHGLIVEEEGRRGLLLPQVPVEHKMNKEQYLDAICQKAGLPKNLWKEKQIKLNGFTATVFDEETIKEGK